MGYAARPMDFRPDVPAPRSEPSRTAELPPALSRADRLSLLLETLVLWSALGTALGLAGWSLALGPRLHDLVLRNTVPLQWRRGLGAALGGSALAMTALGLALWYRPQRSLATCQRAAVRLSPLACAAFLPLIFQWSLWKGHEAPALCLIALAASLRARLAALQARVLAMRALPTLLVAAGVAFYSIIFSIATVRDEYRLVTKDFDLGIENNLIWNAIHWGPLFKSSPLGGPNAVHTGMHQTFFAYLIGIPYRLYPHPEFLLVFQTLMIALAAVPLFLWARPKTGPWAAALLSLAYLFYPPVHGANLYDFHYQPLAPVVVWTALLLYERGKFGWAALLTLVAFSIREDMSLMMAFIAGYLYFSRQRTLAGLVLGVVSMAWFVVQKGIVMPHFLNGEEAFIHQYAQMVAPGEKGFASVVKTCLTNPGFTLDKLLDKDKGIFALQLFAPLLFIPFRSWVGALLLLPIFFFNFLSTDYWPLTQISFQYTVYASMFVFLAVGHVWWQSKDRLRTRAMQAGLAVAMAGASVCFGGLIQHNTAKGGWEQMQFELTDRDRARHAAFYALLEQIPPRVPVASSSWLGPHLSSRPDCYTLRQTFADTEYIVYEQGWLRNEERDTLRRYLEHNEFGLLDRRDSFYLLKRGADPARNREVLDGLR